ncbi:hypothetical protein JCM19000A_08900 [Silvimonas sp. JCM 19000]
MNPPRITRPSLLLVAALSGVLSLSACSHFRSNNATPAATAAATPEEHPAPVNVEASNMQPPAVVLPSRVNAVGYGALPMIDGLTNTQRRLLAMRASKLDAYRSLAETVQGIKLSGQSSVSALALTNDSFRAYVEAWLRGARVVSVTPLPEGGYETVLELQLGSDFYKDAAQAEQGQALAAPALHVQPAMPESAPAPTNASAVSSVTGDTRFAANNFYLSQ